MIAETSGPCIVVFTGDSAFLYLVIKWTVNVTRVWVKMLSFVFHNLVISGSHVPGLRVPGSWVPGLGSQSPGSQVSGSRVSGRDFRLCLLIYYLRFAKGKVY